MDTYTPSRRDKFWAWVVFALLLGAMIVDALWR